MLKSDALQQLSQLKESIQSEKEYAEGTVRGTQSRFGFVLLDDGREAFLPPDTMQQVLPGDRVKVSLESSEKDKDKYEAHLETLLETELKYFVGRYVEKGRNHFVAADHPQLTRWLFVPPRQRRDYRDGDLVSCCVMRHPFGDGRAQVAIEARIGRGDDPGIERQYMIHKHRLRTEWDAAAREQAEAIAALDAPEDRDQREDLRERPFVTIDAESTRDMDDALYAEADGEGWLLQTAIADPAAYVAEDSPLDRAARERASSVYFPGLSLPMFPPELSEGVFSLMPEAERPALVCRMRVNANGEIGEFQFSRARIRARHKLSYKQVSRFLEQSDGEAVPEDARELLNCLKAVADARRNYRACHHIVQESQPDYVFRLNHKQKLERVERRFPTAAHGVVEEAMLATNCCTGALLREIESHNGGPSGGLFSSHAGFRPERLEEIQQLLKKDRPELGELSLEELDSFRTLMRSLQADEPGEQLLATLRRRLQPAAVSPAHGPHFGLGFDHYATATSPIRRYQDLHNQRIITGHLAQRAKPAVAESLPASLQEQIGRNRLASRQLEHWLLCDFLADRVGEEFEAKVTSVSSQGIVVRLTDCGAESYILVRDRDNPQVKYDSLRMTLSDESRHFHLEQSLRVKLQGVDNEKRRLRLSLCEPVDKAS